MGSEKTRQSLRPRVGLYPGTFDPPTLGHLDIIQRAAKIVDKLVIGVAKNDGKGPLFDTKTRVAMVKEEIGRLPRGVSGQIEVAAFDTLLMHFAQDIGASVIVRGLRAVSDFEYEIQMAAMNYRMDQGIETVFLTATEGTQFVSSRFVKEIARLGGTIDSFVGPSVATRLTAAFRQASVRRKIHAEVRD